ncbi:MAG: glycosyltransferase family 39 protein [Phycisphaerae bacterium]
MSRGYIIVLLLVVSAAALFRLCNLGYDSFSHDEAWRANWSHHGSMKEAKRFPPLKFVMLWTIQHAVGRGELVLRLPFAMAGVACVLVLYGFSRRYLDAESAVLVAAVAACHPVLVFYSRTIKEFSLEALVCAVLLWAGLATYRSGTRRQLYLFLLASLAGLGFTFTGALVTAAWMPVLAWRYCWLRGMKAARDESRGSSLRRHFVVVASVLGFVAAGCYVWYTGSPWLAVALAYYDTQEIMFPAAYTPAVLATWLVVSVKGAAQYVLGITHDWPPLSWCVATVEVLAMGTAANVLWKRCRPLCVALMILGVEVVLVGALRIWPMGRLRTMTFLVPILSVVVGCGLWQMMRRTWWSPGSVLLLGACFGVPVFRAFESTVLSPQVSEHIRPAVAHIRSNVQPGDAVFVYYGATSAFEFYADLDERLWRPDGEGVARFFTLHWQDIDVPVQVQPTSDRQNLSAFADRFEAWMVKHPRVWFLFSHDWKNERQEWVEHLQNRYALIDSIDSVNASAHLFARSETVATAQR